MEAPTEEDNILLPLKRKAPDDDVVDLTPITRASVDHTKVSCFVFRTDAKYETSRPRIRTSKVQQAS